MSRWLRICFSVLPAGVSGVEVFNDFVPKQEMTFGSWRGTVSEGRVDFSEIGRSAEFTLLPSLLSRDEAGELLAAMADYNDFSVVADSVDAAPSYEAYIRRDSSRAEEEATVRHLDDNTKQALQRLKDFTAPILEERMLPFINEHFSDLCQGECRACSSLVRRYLEGERRSLEFHQDVNSHVTVVVSLNDFNRDYDGGLYIEGTGKNRPPRRFLPLQAGDMVAHTSDLFHGIDVPKGARWSWITWVQRASCGKRDALAVHLERAKRGDVVAQYTAACMYKEFDDADDEVQALHWMQKAAGQNFSPAQEEIGIWFNNGRYGLQVDAQKALHWLGKATAESSAEAMFVLAVTHIKAGRSEDAQKLLTDAAHLGNRKAMLGLGQAASNAGNLELAAQLLEDAWTAMSLYNRMIVEIQMGSAQDSPEVRRWLEASARLGLKQACDQYVKFPKPSPHVLVSCLSTQVMDGDAPSFKMLLKLYKKMQGHDKKYGQAILGARKALQRFASNALRRGDRAPQQQLDAAEVGGAGGEL